MHQPFNQFSSKQFGVVLVTVSSQAQATQIAQTLVEAKLAACVNFFPIYSVYTWQGNIQQDEEWQLIIKTSWARFADLEAKIHAIHSYEVPEIIMLPIAAGSFPYLQWLSNSVKESNE